MKKISARVAKKIILKTSAILFFLVTLTALVPINIAAAGGCGYICGDPKDTATVTCSKQGMNPGTSFNAKGGAVDCSGTPTDCGMYSKSVCCCTPADSVLTPAGGTVQAAAPEFTMPQFQVTIDTVKLSAATCTLVNGQYQCSVPWLGEYITGVYNYGLSIAGILAAIVLMAGGVLWLVSGGDASKVKQAQELIVGSIVGLIILAGAYVILTVINPNLTAFQPISLNTIQDPEPVSSEGNPNNVMTCSDCKALSSPIPYKDGSMVNTSLDAKLLIAYNKSAAAGLNWRVTEAWPPAIQKHNSTCHYNGMCVDIALTDEATCAKVSQLISILQNAGLSVGNEYSGCGGTASANSTAGHLHVK